MESTSRASSSEGIEDHQTLQFVTTTSTAAIDESSRLVVRKHASRHIYRSQLQTSSSDPNAPSNTKKQTNTAGGGRIHRFRLGPQGLKNTPNQPPQVSQKFTILSVRSDEPPARPVPNSSPFAADVSNFSNALSKSAQGGVKRKGLQDQILLELANTRAVEQLGNSSEQEYPADIDGWLTYQQQVEMPLLSPRTLLYGPSSGSMDPFNAMPLTVTPREQILFRYYFNDRRQASSPLIPYCKVFFGLACQDRASFHAVLSHYSATYRMRFQEESPAESVNHLMAAIKMINKRIGDPRERCSNGTIGAVASLIIYESAYGSLPNVEFHMRGLKEMVRRRGGFQHGSLPIDLKRLIAWADLNTANDLWQRPRFPALDLPVSVDQPSEVNFLFQDIPNFDLSSTPPIQEVNIDAVLAELKDLSHDLILATRSRHLLGKSRISITDKIHIIERRIIDLIHTPPASQNALDHACAVATLMYVRSNVRDSVCNFRTVDTSKLQAALRPHLGDLTSLCWEMSNREKLVWTVGFGAVSSGGRPERPWFVWIFRELCELLDLRRWEYVKVIFETVLWKDDLDVEGVKLWEEMQMI